MSEQAQRYNAVAIVLHWAIAAAILGNFWLGLWMHHAIDATETQAQAIVGYQLHKSIGLSVLALSVLRLVWRLLHTQPSLPSGMQPWERFAAKATHWLFYFFMIAIPLSGWLYVSTQWRHGAPLNVPTLWFGIFEVPHLFGLNHAEQAVRESWAGATKEAHEVLAFASLALLALHVGAALKHQFFKKDGVLARMLPFLEPAGEPSSAARKSTLTLGTIGIAVGILAVVLALFWPSTADNSNAKKQSTQGITSAAGSWQVIAKESELSFSGSHAGVAFKGRFSRWQADIRLDDPNYNNWQLNAEIETASASDGVKLHDSTLPEREWFDVEHHPKAFYKSTRIVQKDQHNYLVYGELYIKENSADLSPLTLTVTDDTAIFSGKVAVAREDVDMGMESDPMAEWVSAEIGIGVNVMASKPSK